MTQTILDFTIESTGEKPTPLLETTNGTPKGTPSKT